MKTKALYMLDPYLKNCEAEVLEVQKTERNEIKILLTQTIFYPLGGGQACDQGKLKFEKESIEVYQVLLQDGEICHYVKTANTLKKGDKLTCEINWERRYKNMLLHSAGHLIDFALIKMGYVPSKLKPLKGEHQKDPYIIYETEAFIPEKSQLQNEVQRLMNSDLEFSWELTDYESLSKRATYLQPGLPTNKPLRILTLEGIGSVADGGTIVKKTSELKGVTILKIEKNNNELKISYDIEAHINKSTAEKETSSEHVYSTNDFKNAELKTVALEFEKELQVCSSEEDFTNLWRKYLGPKGVLKELMLALHKLDNEEKRLFGQELNALKQLIDTKINTAKEEIKIKIEKAYIEHSKSQKQDFNRTKLGHLHPLTRTINDINNIFKKIGYSIYDGPELDTDEYVFQRCNLPVDHPARDLQDSIFIDEPNILLRTQTSSVEAHALQELEPPFKIVVPGRVFRNEKVNRSNHFLFHQYQLVCVKEKVSLVELFSTVQYMFDEFYGKKMTIRFRTKYYPEVEPGAGVDLLCPFCNGSGCPVCKYRGWIEMAGSGIIHPNMIEMAGLDKDKWQGYAFGFGLDRLVMTKYNIQDIRTLLGGDLAYKPFLG